MDAYRYLLFDLDPQLSGGDGHGVFVDPLQESVSKFVVHIKKRLQEQGRGLAVKELIHTRDVSGTPVLFHEQDTDLHGFSRVDPWRSVRTRVPFFSRIGGLIRQSGNPERKTCRIRGLPLQNRELSLQLDVQLLCHQGPDRDLVCRVQSPH